MIQRDHQYVVDHRTRNTPRSYTDNTYMSDSTKVVLAIFAAIFLIGATAAILPQYRVYSARADGEAMLQRSESTKRILVEQAQAELDASRLRKEAIEIMGAAAQQYPEYRLQEFMGAFADAMQNGSVQKIIYVPTEANIPIIEARPSH